MAINIEEAYDKVFHYCYYRFHNKQLAEDLTQETFLRFYNSNYLEQEKEMRYLYTIARNLCIDHSRKSEWLELKKEEAASDDGVFSDQMTDRLYLNLMLDQLSEDDRDLLVMRYVNEEPLSLICDQLNITRFAVYRKLNNIRKQLQKWTEGGNLHES